MCYFSARIFFLCSNVLTRASPGVQHPASGTTGPEDVPRKNLLPPSTPSSPAANNPLLFFHFPSFPLAYHHTLGYTLLGQVFFGGASWGEAAPHLHPILWLCHGPNSVLIFLAPMNFKNRFVACFLFTGTFRQELAEIAEQAGLGFDFSSREIPA